MPFEMFHSNQIVTYLMWDEIARKKYMIILLECHMKEEWVWWRVFRLTLDQVRLLKKGSKVMKHPLLLVHNKDFIRWLIDILMSESYVTLLLNYSHDDVILALIDLMWYMTLSIVSLVSNNFFLLFFFLK